MFSPPPIWLPPSLLQELSLPRTLLLATLRSIPSTFLAASDSPPPGASAPGPAQDSSGLSAPLWPSLAQLGLMPLSFCSWSTQAVDSESLVHKHLVRIFFLWSVRKSRTLPEIPGPEDQYGVWGHRGNRVNCNSGTWERSGKVQRP